MKPFDQRVKGSAHGNVVATLVDNLGINNVTYFGRLLNDFDGGQGIPLPDLSRHSWSPNLTDDFFYDRPVMIRKLSRNKIGQSIRELGPSRITRRKARPPWRNPDTGCIASVLCCGGSEQPLYLGYFIGDFGLRRDWLIDDYRKVVRATATACRRKPIFLAIVIG